MSNVNVDYQRVLISGSLTTQSPLHIGTGYDDTSETDSSLGGDAHHSANTILCDHAGNPYIPASTLRGFLRGTFKQAKLSTDDLFGEARQRSGSDRNGTMGKLRVYDCIAEAETVTTSSIKRTAINPVTATAKQHSFNNHHTVEAGTVFVVTIELDRCSQAEVEGVLSAMNCFNATATRIGKGKSTGWGALQWKPEPTKSLSTSQMKDWLCDGLANSKPEYTEIPGLIETAPLSTTQWKTFAFHLQACSPLLINSPELVGAEQTRAGKAVEKHSPDLICSVQTLINNRPCNASTVNTLNAWLETAGKENDTKEKSLQDDSPALSAFIPGSTLKGWLRGRCRKILLTIAGGEHASTRADAFLSRLFGGTDEGAGLLRFEDLRAAITARDCHRQTFNAVDRFTGGVKESALYDVIAVCPSEPFKGGVYYRSRKKDSNENEESMTEGMKLLLLFVLRDAMEGDLVLGWGKSKGYGRLTLQPDDYADWQAFRSKHLIDTQQGFQELRKELGIAENTKEATA